MADALTFRRVSAAAGFRARNSRRPSVAISRRRLLAGGGALAGLALLARFATDGARAAARFTADPFSLGVASGDPLPDGVLLWTRLALDPLHGGGMPNRPIPVDYEVARDAAFKNVVRRGQ